jgi:hypothetical protein
MENPMVEEARASTDELGRIGASGRENSDHFTLPHKVLNWPMINHHLSTRGAHFVEDLRDISSRGSPWFVELSKQTSSSSVSTSRTSLVTPTSATTPTTHLFHQYGEMAIKGYMDAYFCTFNKIRPILDQAFFVKEIELQLAPRSSSNRDTETVLLLLVIALGQLVYEGTAGASIEVFTRRTSGIRGGTALRPPGAICFEESLRLWTLIPVSTSLLAVQVLLLQASFYESSARHWDFWESAAAASAVCERLIRQRSFHWKTSNGEMVKRAYWACVLDEGYYHQDLDLPESGILALQDDVPLPSFFRAIDEPPIAGIQATDSPKAYLYFLASISLKRLVDRIHDVVHESMSQI